MESHREGIFDGIRRLRRKRRDFLTRESKSGSPRARACARARTMEWSFVSDRGGAARKANPLREGSIEGASSRVRNYPRA